MQYLLDERKLHFHQNIFGMEKIVKQHQFLN